MLAPVLDFNGKQVGLVSWGLNCADPRVSKKAAHGRTIFSQVTHYDVLLHYDYGSIRI
jgi:hypothetical protein